MQIDDRMAFGVTLGNSRPGSGDEGFSHTCTKYCAEQDFCKCALFPTPWTGLKHTCIGLYTMILLVRAYRAVLDKLLCLNWLFKPKVSVLNLQGRCLVTL